LALLASPTEQLDAARYFETTDHKQFDKAVILYEKEENKLKYFRFIQIFSRFLYFNI